MIARAREKEEDQDVKPTERLKQKHTERRAEEDKQTRDKTIVERATAQEIRQ